MLNILWVFYIFFMMRRGGDSRYWFSIGIILISLYEIFKRKELKIKEFKKLYVFSIGYIIFLTLSYILYSSNQLDTINYFLNIILYGIIFMIIVMNYKLNDKFYKYIIPLISILSLNTIYRGLKEITIFFNNPSYRIGGGNYTTVYAVEIGLYIIISIIGIIYYKNKKIKILYGLYLFINLILLFGTRSRALMLMLPLTFLIFLYIRKVKYGIIATCILCILGISGIKYTNKISVLKRMSTLRDVKTIEKDPRIYIYKKAVEIEKKEFANLMGIGFYKYKTLRLNTGVEMVPHFHNNLIEVLLTQGLLAFIFYLGMNICIFVELLKIYKKENKNRILINVTVLYFIFITFVGIVEVTFYMTRANQILFTLLGLTFCLRREDIE